MSQIKNTTQGATSSKSTQPSSSSSSNSGSSTTARKAYALLEKYLTMWLVGDENDKRLVYDAQLGGILSKEGLEDINRDFGNARYNDHHFHYGYVLYASAILGRANPKFISQYGPFVDALFYDVANNSADARQNNVGKEIFFPLARHKSWFDGHSFASGLFPFANGKSQESSSEAINCYFGAYLWARVRWGSSSSMVDYTRLLLATEMTGAKTYWHMTPPPQGKKSAAKSSSGSSNVTLPSNKGSSLIPIAYDAVFRKNYMVGNLGMTDVTSTTWFGNENIYVHLINFMPVTAITSELFDKGYVKGERSVLSDNDSVENAWRGYSICNEAIIDPNAAWLEAQNLISTQLDPGLSKSQVLFWLSTREGFSSSTTVEVSNSDSDVMSDEDIDAGSETPEQDDTSSSSSSIKNNADTAPKVANAQSTLARCSSHEKCVAEGLLGVCCPTNEGVFLHCCS